MTQDYYYKHVSGWIKTYRDTEALGWLRRFINNSTQPHEIKDRLHKEIDLKMAGLEQKPHFTEMNGITLLADAHGHPEVFTTRFSALCKLTELQLKGYNVSLKPGKVFYRIKLNEQVAVNN
jgi:hypothetical protein